MKLGIITQPLHSNYGGVLQNFALQRVLSSLGHTPVTIDQKKKVSFFKYILSVCKSLIYILLGKKRVICGYKSLVKRPFIFDNFVCKQIKTTAPTGKISRKFVGKYKFDGFVVGSDQVWRPRYNEHNLYDMFLAFCSNMPVRRVAYAASFGVDNWEYNDAQTAVCAKYAQSFDAISVREDSAVSLCEDYLKVPAVKVLDPTLLLDKSKYEDISYAVPRQESPFLFAYILDLTPEKRAFVKSLETQLNIKSHIHSADTMASLSIEQWVAMFRDASYVVTDSFHGTCFSIIFEKDFYSIGNKRRGATRFNSLLECFNLQARYVDFPLTEPVSVQDRIDWNAVRNVLEIKKSESVNFLEKNLK